MSTDDNLAADDRRMARYYAERATYYERGYFKPERQPDLRRMEAELPAYFTGRRVLEPDARVVMLDNRFVPASNLPISRRDEDGNTYQLRTLDDGSTCEVVENFPSADAAIAALGPRAHDARWIAYEYYWVLVYELD